MFADRLVLHDQSLLGRYRDAVFGDEEKGDGEDAAGTRALPFDLDAGVIHEYLRAYYLLRRNRQVGTRHRRSLVIMVRGCHSYAPGWLSVLVHPREIRSRFNTMTTFSFSDTSLTSGDGVNED